MPKSGKIICATFFEKSLDKMLAVWYNGISGAGIRQRPAQKSIGKNAQKKVEPKNRLNNKHQPQEMNWARALRNRTAVLVP